VSFLAKDCARARESVSVQLDGELSDFALDRLETHLRICPECSTWAEQVRDTTRQLREASLEGPVHRLVLPRSRRSWRVSSAVALASAAAVVATMFVSPSGQRTSAGHHAVPELLLSANGVRISTPRSGALEDGRFIAISMASASQARFRPA
jgi:predicted anti-sigma-YlaC factor YlaD